MKKPKKAGGGIGVLGLSMTAPRAPTYAERAKQAADMHAGDIVRSHPKVKKMQDELSRALQATTRKVLGHARRGTFGSPDRTPPAQ